VWYLRRGADAKEAKQLLTRDSASVDTFKRLVAAERRDDALVELKRILEAPYSAETIAALHALSEMTFSFEHDQTRSYTETTRQTIAFARARIAQLPREDAARLARELLLIDQWLEGRQASQKWACGSANEPVDYVTRALAPASSATLPKLPTNGP
jgi:hypothetical protein